MLVAARLRKISMQIILLHPRFSQARSITLSIRHLLGFALLFSLAVGAAAIGVDRTFGQSASWHIPFLSSVAAVHQPNKTNTEERIVKENLTNMAIKLGDMQAQLTRLDALGERVQGLAGVKPEEFNFKELPGRGGAEPSSVKSFSRAASMGPETDMAAFKATLDAMARDVEHRADYFNVVETTLMTDRLKAKQLPTTQPVDVSYNASGFGWRFDPFNGRSAFHEGIDFPAPVGTAIVAAAGGVVIAAEYHHDFGNMLEIDHGNNIVTRYAHASRLLMKVGDIVRRGQHIADIGSTGHSTGAHLHFEVIVKGTPQDPNKFLAAGASQASLAALGAK
jgi:murein DD-endopeptidase MepM/ murein hydrolase activator NlpD